LDRELRLAVLFTVAKLGFVETARTVDLCTGGFETARPFVEDPALTDVVRLLLEDAAVSLLGLVVGFAAGFLELPLPEEDEAPKWVENIIMNAATNRLRIRAIILPSGPVTG
jgi:hypothetical protein